MGETGSLGMLTSCCVEGWFPSMLKAVSSGRAVVRSIFGFMMDNSFEQ